MSDLPDKYKNKKKDSSFINDIAIAITSLSIGAVLFTENKTDYKIIIEYLKGLRVEFL